MFAKVSNSVPGSPQQGFTDRYKNKIYKVEVIAFLFLTVNYIITELLHLTQTALKVNVTQH